MTKRFLFFEFNQFGFFLLLDIRVRELNPNDSYWRTAVLLFNPIAEWTRGGVYTFLLGINLKVNVMARLEYELAYLEAAVQYFSH